MHIRQRQRQSRQSHNTVGQHCTVWLLTLALLVSPTWSSAWEWPVDRIACSIVCPKHIAVPWVINDWVLSSGFCNDCSGHHWPLSFSQPHPNMMCTHWPMNVTSEPTGCCCVTLSVGAWFVWMLIQRCSGQLVPVCNPAVSVLEI